MRLAHGRVFLEEEGVRRCVEPEILDELPSHDRDAVRSRRDLRVINGIMGNHRWIAHQLRRVQRSDWRVLELGAGDGTLARRLVQRGIVAPSFLSAMDLAPQPGDWPAGASWRQGDVIATTWPPAEIVVANLFLHHFERDALATIGRRLSEHAEVMICSEPARRRLHLWQGKLLGWMIWLNRVTRHDLPVSVRAGFRGNELAESLGISHWKISVSTTLFGAYRLVARKS